jgi:hypothetical protein
MGEMAATIAHELSQLAAAQNLQVARCATGCGARGGDPAAQR